MNRPLQKFLIALAADDDLRDRFNRASDAEQDAILADEFKIGPKTRTAVLSGDADRLRERLRVSDQNGNKTVRLADVARKAGSKK
jgi:hypothetical protein